MTTTEKINEHYRVDDTYEFHVEGKANDVHVWINIGTDYNGIAIGGGASRAEAVRDAVETLERALSVLKGVE